MPAKIIDCKKYIQNRITIDPITGCWEWNRARLKTGYGVCSVVFLNKRYYYAHRLSFVVAGGLFTANKSYCIHSCDNPPCCNPAHLRAGSQQDNMDDMVAHGRSGKGQLKPRPQKVTDKMVASRLKRLGPVITPIGQFTTLAKAALIHMCHVETIRNRIKNPNFPGYYRKKPN